MEHLAREETHAGGEDETPGSDTTGAGIPAPDTPGTDTINADTPVPDIPVPDTTNADTPVHNQMTSLITGFGILFFIMLLCTMYTVSPLIAETGQGAGLATASPDVVPKIVETPVPGPVTTVPTPGVTPVIISSTPVPQITRQPAGPKSYVTIEAVPATVSPPLQDISSDLPVPGPADFFTIYSMTGQKAQQNLPYVSFGLENPPLVIDYTVTPMNITNTKDVDYKIITTVFHEKLTINREYEQDWFKVVVRDRDTGKVVMEDGYGKTYSLEQKRQLVVYKSGNYRVEFTGEFVTVDLTMKVKKEGNIESG
jgi:hypothetical protein